jgi:gliding motility-associated-like protein
MKLRILIFLLSLAFFIPKVTQATHLQAGQITLTRLDPISLTYRITLIVYRDKVNLFGSGPTAELADRAFIVVYDNANNEIARLTAPLTDLRDLNSDVQQGTYVTTYTFAGSGTFKIAFSESYRNGCVVNMNAPDSTDLYVESQIVINQFLGVNNSPVLLAAPVDYAGLGQAFFHNPAAYDPDGDSLSFKLVTPQSGLNTNVRNYRDLTNYLGPAEGGGPGQYFINPTQGTVVWNTPNTIGCFNIAIKVEEWRRRPNGTYAFLGYVIRDMQIIVRNSNNKRPILNIPNNICVAANENITANITATDPDLHCIRFEAVGQMFDAGSPPPKAFLTYSGGNYTNQCLASPASITFNWNPSCEYIRERPYQVLFKATDNPPPVVGPPLVDIKVWEIKVVGPKPQNLQANVDNTNDFINLTWSPYVCAAQARELIIWRREGCPTNNPAICDVGAPDGQGYYEIGRVLANATSFTDRTARIGVVYSYRISAVFPPPKGGESYASDEVCASLAIDVPLFTKVDVTETSTTTGKVRVEFIQPFEFPLGTPPSPFGYKVYRAEGIRPTANSQYTEVFSLLNVDPNDPNVLGFTDNSLNTTERQYHYRIAFFANATNESTKQFRDSSDAASTVRLNIDFVSSCLRLIWNYDVPWGGNRGFTHDIFRSVNNPNNFTDIGDFFASFQDRGTFDDSNVFQQTNYFYYTTTRGWYFNNAILVRYPSLAVPLENNSQINNASPRDVIKPCPPILSLQEIDCNNFTQTEPYTNKLSWINDPDGGLINPNSCGNVGDGCEFEPSNIAFFKIFYKPNLEASYTEIGQVPGNVFTFDHTGLFSLAGCYVVSAVDKAGNEGDFSNEVCVDNCINFLLPNAFSPNGDQVNDTFTPYENELYSVRFVERIEFEVYNRWGKKVFEGNNDIRINWNGSTNTSEINDLRKILPAGIYYYVARVRFFRLNPKDAEKIYKGWVQIVK